MPSSPTKPPHNQNPSTKSSRKRTDKLASFLAQDKLFAAQLDILINNSQPQPPPSNPSTSLPPSASASPVHVPQKPQQPAAVPMEETPFDTVAPGLLPNAHLRVLRMHPSRGVISGHSAPNEEKRSTNPLDFLLSAISKGRGSPSRHQQHDDPLASMFDNEPSPVEFEVPKEFPSFHIELSKPVPQPVFESIRPEKIDENSHSKRKSSNRYLVSEIDSEDSPESEYINGHSVGTIFEYKETQYFRYIEPSEEELSHRVEYDMDEQDKFWLETQNQQRYAQTSDPPIPAIVFEHIIDRFEKEYFQILKAVPKPQRDSHEPEDNNCAICDDGECENSNAIVFCDGCNLAVHQDCYGVPFIPEGQWLCRKCMLSPDRNVTCTLCPMEGGALKQTNTSRWAHVVCAQWIPEASFGNPTYMEPIDSRSIPPSRYKLNCYICGRKKGACIQCTTKNCYASYHVTCAKKCKLFMKLGVDDMKSYCDKHSPKDYKERVDPEKEIFLFRRANNFSNVKYKPTPEFEAELLLSLHRSHETEHYRPNSRDSSPTRKRAKLSDPNFSDFEAVPMGRGKSTDKIHTEESDNEDSELRDSDNEAIIQEQEYRRLIAAPIAPSGIVRTVVSSIRGSSHFRGKNAFVEKCARYWALKRQGRRGAPLLKRLHLEPWTATSSVIQQDETIRAKRMDVLRKIRNDLERVRMLCELVKKRERERLKKATLQLQIFDLYKNPVTFLVRPVLERLRKLDMKGFFEEPVDLEEVPDYLTIVKNPMCFETMEEKVENNEYRFVTEFKSDFELICSNAKIYNKQDTTWYRAADRLLERSSGILEEVMEQEQLLTLDPDFGCLAGAFPAEIFRKPVSAEADKVFYGRVFSDEINASSEFKKEPEFEDTSPNTTSVREDLLSDEDRQAMILEDEKLALALQEEEETRHSPRHRRKSQPLKSPISNPISSESRKKRSFRRGSSAIPFDADTKTSDAYLTEPRSYNDDMVRQIQKETIPLDKLDKSLIYAGIHIAFDESRIRRKRNGIRKTESIFGKYPEVPDKDFTLPREIRDWKNRK